jgi:hypothetical protein
LRLGDNDKVCAIAGPIGCVRSDLSLHLRMAALSPQAKEAACDLFDARLIDADAGGQPFIVRLPANAYERRMLRVALGLRTRKKDQEVSR